MNARTAFAHVFCVAIGTSAHAQYEAPLPSRYVGPVTYEMRVTPSEPPDTAVPESHAREFDVNHPPPQAPPRTHSAPARTVRRPALTRVYRFLIPGEDHTSVEPVEFAGPTLEEYLSSAHPGSHGESVGGPALSGMPPHPDGLREPARLIVPHLSESDWRPTGTVRLDDRSESNHFVSSPTPATELDYEYLLAPPAEFSTDINSPPSSPPVPTGVSQDVALDSADLDLPPLPSPFAPEVATYDMPHPPVVTQPIPETGRCGCEISCDAGPIFESSVSPWCVPAATRFAPFANFSFKGGDRVLGEGRVFVPFFQKPHGLLFVDARGQLDDREAKEGNFGLGWRSLIHPNWIFGVYGYYDVLRSAFGNTFNQGSLGAELMSLNWDFRVNGYFPDQSGKPTGAAAGVSNGTIVVNQFEERAYAGFDAEMGRRMLHWGWNDAFELRWFVGGYFFNNGATGFESFGGPQTRLEFRSYGLPWLGHQSRLEMGAEMTWDRVRNEQVFGFVRLRVPLFPSRKHQPLRPLQRRLVDLPVRDIDVVTHNAPESSESAINPWTGDPIRRLVRLNANDNFLGAISDAGKDSVVVFDGARGDFSVSGTPGIVLHEGQTLLGGGSTIDVIGERSGQQFSFRAPGSRGMIRSDALEPEPCPDCFVIAAQTPADAPAADGTVESPGTSLTYPGPGASVVRLNDWSTVQGVDIRGGGGIEMTNVAHARLNDVAVSDSQGSGVSIHGSSDVALHHVQINRSRLAGTQITDSEYVHLDSVEMIQPGHAGIRAYDVEHLDIQDVFIDSGSRDAPDTDVEFTPGTVGIRVTKGADISIADSTILGTVNGIELNRVDGEIRIASNLVDLSCTEMDGGHSLGIGLFARSVSPTNAFIENNVVKMDDDLWQSPLMITHERPVLRDGVDAFIVTDNQFSGLNGRSFEVQSSADHRTSVKLQGNSFHYMRFGLDGSPAPVLSPKSSDELSGEMPLADTPSGVWRQPDSELFRATFESGTHIFQMTRNEFTVDAFISVPEAWAGRIESRHSSLLESGLQNNVFLGDVVEVFRDVDSRFIISREGNNVPLELAPGSAPIDGVPDNH